MFTGIVEALGRIESVEISGSNTSFVVASEISHELKIDQSVSHNGVCLTVENVFNSKYMVTAVAETLGKTNLGKLHTGSFVNLERCLKVGDRLDGHMVQGHVDETAICTKIVDNNGSKTVFFEYDSKNFGLLVTKGSITINGVSLTLVDVKKSTFSVVIIPFTWNNTTFQYLQKGDHVNIEFDILGKYVLKNLIFLSQP